MNEEATNTEQPDEGNIQQLREEYKRLKAENKEYKQNVMNSTLNSLGLEADKGIGKAVTKLYDGEMNNESIKQFVEEEFGEVGAINAKTEPAPVTENVVEAQSRVEQLNKLGVDNKPQDIMNEFASFVTDSDTKPRDTINAKLRMIETLEEQNK